MNHKLIGFLFIFLVMQPAWTQSVVTAETYFPLEVLSISDDARLSPVVLLADKAKRQLSIIDREGLLKGELKRRFEIDIGKNSGPKLKRNDKKTPEGIYLLLEKKRPPEIPFEQYGEMAFTTNYPNYFDRFDKKTGDGIWIHSVPDTVPLTRGSRGCVVLRNEALRQVEPYIELGKTFVVINDTIRWIEKTEHQKQKDIAQGWYTNWKTLWENQNIDEYIKLYAEEFTAPGFNKQSWYKHKLNLKNKYKYVKVKVSTPHIFQVKNQFLFKFVQEYESDEYTDIGIKYLYVHINGNELKVQREEWYPLPAVKKQSTVKN